MTSIFIGYLFAAAGWGMLLFNWLSKEDEMINTNKVKNISIILYMVSVLTLLIFALPAQYKQGQIDALNDNWRYKKVYIHEKNDTIPIDSIYLKTKKYEHIHKENKRKT